VTDAQRRAAVELARGDPTPIVAAAHRASTFTTYKLERDARCAGVKRVLAELARGAREIWNKLEGAEEPALIEDPHHPLRFTAWRPTRARVVHRTTATTTMSTMVVAKWGPDYFNVILVSKQVPVVLVV
jgi:hypothetical protein